MVVFNYSGREINAKIVYYGPGLSGKTTNLERIYGQVPEQRRGKMVSMKTRSDRTLFFDFLPVSGGEIKGFRTRYLLYTVPGQVHYNATRKLVLKGTDAIIFVADSDPALRDANIESMQNLEENLAEYGLSTDKIPIIIQYNKRDVPNPMSIESLNADLNPRGWPWFEGVAIEDKGVWETFRAAVDALFKTLEENLGGDDSVKKAEPAKPQDDQEEPALASPAESEGGITLSGDVTGGEQSTNAPAPQSRAGDASYDVDESIKGDAPVKLSDPNELASPPAEQQQEAASSTQEPARGTQNGQNLDWRENYIPPGATPKTSPAKSAQAAAVTEEPSSPPQPETAPQPSAVTGQPEVGHVDQAPAAATVTASANDGVVHVPVRVHTENGVVRLEISINLRLEEGAQAAVVDTAGEWK